MFTGIVEDMGTVVTWSQTGKDDGWILTVEPDHPDLFFSDPTALTYLGASISVSGVCLTVTSFDEKSLTFGVAPETVRRTNFSTFSQGKKKRVNLERASLSSGRNSGHYVQGHVDGYGTVIRRWTEKDSIWLEIEVSDPDLMPSLVPKGFIAMEGTSLTVCDVKKSSFTLMMIEHTQKHVVPQIEGSVVNLELDVMAKYATAFLQQKLVGLEATIRTLESRLTALENDETRHSKRAKNQEDE